MLSSFAENPLCESSNSMNCLRKFRSAKQKFPDLEKKRKQTSPLSIRISCLCVGANTIWLFKTRCDNTALIRNSVTLGQLTVEGDMKLSQLLQIICV